MESGLPSVNQRSIVSPLFPPSWESSRGHGFQLFWGLPGVVRAVTFTQPPAADPWLCSVAMATNREQQVGHMTGFPPAVYPFAFNSMRSHSPFDLLANSSLFGRFGADLPKEMAALCKSILITVCLTLLSSTYRLPFQPLIWAIPSIYLSDIKQFAMERRKHSFF